MKTIVCGWKLETELDFTSIFAEEIVVDLMKSAELQSVCRVQNVHKKVIINFEK